MALVFHYYDYTGERDHAFKWAEKKGEDGLEEYKKEKNMVAWMDCQLRLLLNLFNSFNNYFLQSFYIPATGHLIFW